jgi:hypothetical protein
VSAAFRLSPFDLDHRVRLDARSRFDPDRSPRAAKTVRRITPRLEPAPFAVWGPLRPA